LRTIAITAADILDGVPGDLLAISDLHVGYRDNRAIVESLTPTHPDDWLIVAGDVGERVAHVEWALSTLASRFATVVWAPGNHELWTMTDDPDPLRGEARYLHLVDLCRRLGVVTPEDPYPVWSDGFRSLTVAPLLTLYDYTWRPDGTDDYESAMAAAVAAGVVCTDEMFLHPDPFPSRQEWCVARVAETEKRLAALPGDARTVLVSHWPLVREPTRVLRYPEFALWCGTELTADWHLRFNAEVAVYGHLHIPRDIEVDGVPFREVSVGYPREWQPRGRVPGAIRVLEAAR